MTDTPDLNELIRELNEDPLANPETRPESPDSARLDGWLGQLVQRAGSDLLLVAGAPPSVRIDGRISPLAGGPLSGDEIEEAMVPDAYVTSSDASLETVADEMASRRLGSAIVVADNDVVGVFTAVDALRALADALRSPRGAGPQAAAR